MSSFKAPEKLGAFLFSFLFGSLIYIPYICRVERETTLRWHPTNGKYTPTYLILLYEK